MMYYSILASFCLLGMASSQKIDGLTACLNKDQKLNMNCRFSDAKNCSPICLFQMDKKVVASTDSKYAQDSTYKNRASVNLNGNECLLTLSGFEASGPESYNCTIFCNGNNDSKVGSVEKKNTSPCSDCNVLKHGGVILLLAIALSLLSGIL